MIKSHLHQALADDLSVDELHQLPRAFDIVGDIAIMKIPPNLRHKSTIIAAGLFAVNRHVKTVLNQISSVSGDYRLRELEYVWGEKKTETRHREYGCVFIVDLANVYFSPRLSYERMRVADLVQPGEVVLNMFAGVGCFSIMIAKHSEAHHIYSIDLNPAAVTLMQENIALNRVMDKVSVIHGDAEEVVAKGLLNVADRILMPLPEKAYVYLDAAITALKFRRGIIHYYDFIQTTADHLSIERVIERVTLQLEELGHIRPVISSRVVRTVGPNRSQVVLDIHVK